MDNFKLSAKSTLAEIKAQVFADFNVRIDNDTAHAIREAHKGGTIVWTPAHLTTTDKSHLNIHHS
jgi:hypothetical protein